MKFGHNYPFYSEPPDNRNQVLFYCAIGSVAVVAIGIATYKGEVESLLAFAPYVSASFALVLYAVVNKIFDNYLWKQQAFRSLLRLSGTSFPPDISGDYYAELRWSTVEPGKMSGNRTHGTSYADVKIIQTWSKIAVVFSIRDSRTLMPRASSSSLMALIEETADGKVLLNYLYEYQGAIQKEDHSVDKEVFNGTCRLEFFNLGGAGWRFRGDFYSDDRGTGTVTQIFEFPINGSCHPRGGCRCEEAPRPDAIQSPKDATTNAVQSSRKKKRTKRMP